MVCMRIESIIWSIFTVIVIDIVTLPYMAGLALVTPRTAVQGGHGLTVKTMFRFYPSSLNKDECWLGLAD